MGSRPNCWWPSCAPKLMIQLCVTLPSEDTGQELLLLCTLSSWRLTLSVLSLVSAREPSSPPQPVTNAPDQSVQLLLSLSPRHRSLRSLLSLREMDTVEVLVMLIVLLLLMPWCPTPCPPLLASLERELLSSAVIYPPRVSAVKSLHPTGLPPSCLKNVKHAFRQNVLSILMLLRK